MMPEPLTEPLFRPRFVGQLRRCLSLLLAAVIMLSCTSQAREPWVTSRITGSPEPPLPYVTERAFPELKFNQCLDLVAEPGGDRWFVVEQSGKIFSFVNRPDVATTDLVLDFAKAIPGVEQVYSLAFHPDFRRNRLCYVCYIKAPNQADGTHVAQFKMPETAPPTIDATSEKTLVTWWSGGHNGCHLLFGPDGYLYISAGDANAANPPDIFRTGQDLSDLPASILRIDVDLSDADKNYRIPQDNPFVDTPGVRAEIWAYGLRNPWRMSFDRKTGDLWCGDVGWESWEMLHRIVRGGNYGWAIKEAHQPIYADLKPGPTPILPPIVEHPHTESTSITEGLTYYGSQLKALHGVHIYSDYDTGKLWGLRYDNGLVSDRQELADTTHRVVSFGEDIGLSNASGEFYLLDHVAGTIHRLIDNPNSNSAGDFPRVLSQTGLWSSTANLQPASGVVPYKIQAEPWADYAVSQRWVAIPNDLAISSESANWTFPKDSVLVKTFMLDMQAGAGGDRRKVETQILHFDGHDWMPYSYRWNEDQSDAALVPAQGDELSLEIMDASAPGGKRQQVWRFPGRAECQRCHNKYSGTVLGFTAPILNVHQNGESQLEQFEKIRLLSQAVPEKLRDGFTTPHAASGDIDLRARSYLHVNCAHCHRMSAGGAVLSYMHADLPLSKTNMLARPSQGTFGILGAQVIAPGDPWRSILLYRMSKLGGGRMPHIGSSEVDVQGVALIRQWISQLPRPADAEPNSEAVAHHRRSEQLLLEQLLSHADSPSANQTSGQLLSTTTGASVLLAAIDEKKLPVHLVASIIEQGASHADDSVRDLFERLVPAQRRVKRLGSVVQPTQILALTGDVARGQKLFADVASITCKNCHRVGSIGIELGPDLTGVGKRLSPVQILESILDPGKVIDPKYVVYAVETHDGRVLSGLLVSRDQDRIVIKNARNEITTLKSAEVEQLVPQRASMMPELLVRDMTGQQVADLITYLSTLK